MLRLPVPRWGSEFAGARCGCAAAPRRFRLSAARWQERRGLCVRRRPAILSGAVHAPFCRAAVGSLRSKEVAGRH